jgi:hypothetical protein
VTAAIGGWLGAPTTYASKPRVGGCDDALKNVDMNVLAPAKVLKALESDS